MYVIIDKNIYGGYIIRYNGDKTIYYYSYKEALQRFRRDNNLQYKHLNIIKIF